MCSPFRRHQMSCKSVQHITVRLHLVYLCWPNHLNLLPPSPIDESINNPVTLPHHYLAIFPSPSGFLIVLSPSSEHSVFLTFTLHHNLPNTFQSSSATSLHLITFVRFLIPSLFLTLPHTFSHFTIFLVPPSSSLSHLPSL